MVTKVVMVGVFRGSQLIVLFPPYSRGFVMNSFAFNSTFPFCILLFHVKIWQFKPLSCLFSPVLLSVQRHFWITECLFHFFQCFFNILKMLSLIISSLCFSSQHAKERSFTHKLWKIKSTVVWNFSLTIIDFTFFPEAKMSWLLIVCHDALLHSASFSSIFQKVALTEQKGSN